MYLRAANEEVSRHRSFSTLIKTTPRRALKENATKNSNERERATATIRRYINLMVG